MRTLSKIQPVIFFFVLLVSACFSLIIFYFKEVEYLFDPFAQHCSALRYTNLVKHILKQEDQNKTLDKNPTVVDREFFHYLAKNSNNVTYPGIKYYIQYNMAQLQVKPLKNVKPLQPDFGLIFHDVKNFNYSIEILPCTKAVLRGFFVAIISATNNFDKRDIIRQTWLRKMKKLSVLRSLSLSGYGFIVGLTKDRKTQTRIKEESDSYGDILQINVIDHYFNLTYKVVGLLNWIDSRCSKVDFVLKVDDDVFINVHNLEEVMKTLDPSEKSLYGSRADSIPLRDRYNGKHYISFEHWPWSLYPPYLKGATIIIPGTAIRFLLAASQTTPFFPFDDVYLTGLSSSKAGINLQFSDRLSVGYSSMFLEAPKPCHVFHSITWVTQSVDHFNMSNWATNNFYKNVTQCVIPVNGGETRTFDSKDSEIFVFATTGSNE